MATFPPSFWKGEALGHSHTFPRDESDHDHTPPLLKKSGSGSGSEDGHSLCLSDLKEGAMVVTLIILS